MYSTRYACQILMEIKFSGPDLKKKTRISNLMEIRPMGTESFHAGGRTDTQTDMTKLKVASRN